jgi:rhodanese-related sulfurtransferase
MDTPVIDRADVSQAILGGRATLVMAMGEWAYRAAHIPGSLCGATPAALRSTLSRDDEIIVYCAGPLCPASRAFARVLRRLGFQHVRVYVGGLEDWAAAGHPLAGTMTERAMAA